MHVLIATDGSRQSLASATYLRAIVDPSTVTSVGVVAVLSPLAAVPFVKDDAEPGSTAQRSYRRAAEEATAEIAAGLEGWGPLVTTHVYSGTPATEILQAAERFGSGLIVIASRSSRRQAVLMGSVAHKVMNQATCPVLVHRATGQPRRAKKRAAKKAAGG